MGDGCRIMEMFCKGEKMRDPIIRREKVERMSCVQINFINFVFFWLSRIRKEGKHGIMSNDPD